MARALPLPALGITRSRLFPNRVRVYAHEDVTVVGDEAAPGDGGLTRDQVERIWQSVVGYYGTGLQPSMTLVVRRHGAKVLERTIGHQRGNVPGDPLGFHEQATPQTLYNLFSASKCILAMLVHLLDDRGLLHLDDAVEEYIPEFGRNGKQHITVRHVLLHRAGIPSVPGGKPDLDLLTDQQAIMRVLADTRPSSRAGRRIAYHAVTGGFILAEIVHRVTGKTVRELLQEEVCDKLGFEHFNYGVDRVDLPRVAQEAFTGPRPRFPGSWLFRRSLGVDVDEAVALANDPRFLTGIIPSGNIICTADEAGRFFECMLRKGELDGKRVFDRRTVRRAVAEESLTELDMIMMLPVRWSMGFMLGRKRLSFYGPDSTRAFGHLGFTNTLAYADPERDISVAFLCNGKPFLAPELLLWMNVTRTIAETVPRRKVRWLSE